MLSHKDKRGSFTELLRPENLTKKQFGQLSLTTIFPNQSKGDHYHKIRWEWFYLAKGKVTVKLVHVKTGQKKSILLSARNQKMICIPPLWNHVLVNSQKEEAIACVYSSIPFRKSRPDVYRLE